MATSNRKTSAKAENQNDDLLEQVGNDDEQFDLLDEVVEDDSEAWVPEENEGIQGTVVKVGTTSSDFDDEPVPVVVFATKDGRQLRYTAYQTIPRRELRDADPHPGDTIAIKRFADGAVKKGKFAGKPLVKVGIAIRRAQQLAS